jgi:Protein of unknown function (DUF3089)
VLVGHSQGAGLLNRLIAEEIDDEPLLRDRLVSAYLLGSTVAVPEGDVAGGAFDNVPPCEADDQTGCVVSSTPMSPWGTSKTWSPTRPRRTRPAADGANRLVVH